MSSLKESLKKPSFTITLFYIFIVSITVPAVILSFTENFDGISGAMANSVLPIGVFLLLASLSRNVGRTVWLMFPLMFFAAFQTVLLDLYGRSVIAVDMFLNLVTTNAGEVSELLSNMLPVVILVIVVYVPQLTLATVCIRNHVRLPSRFVKNNRIVAMAVTAVGLVFLIIAETTSRMYSVLDDLYPINICYNIYLAADRTAKTARYHTTSNDFTYNAVDTDTVTQRKIVVLIVGETSRASNWQLCGYDRATNPRLSHTPNLHVFSHALSESNTTHKSVPMLLSAIDATSYDSIYYTKSIITAFKEAGYSTAFFSNQRRNHSFIDFFGMEADTVSFIREHIDAFDCPDKNLLPSMAEVLKREAPRQLIVLHAYGSHFNYNDRYESSDSVFGPTDYPEASASHREKLINAYDNSIVATDGFISKAITMIDSANVSSVMIYTSDHGEDIYDDEHGYFLHASPLPTFKQVHVPFLVWTSKQYAEQYPEKIAALKSQLNKSLSSSRSYFHTAIDLASLRADAFSLAASLASPDYTPREPIYLNDHNEPVKLGEIDNIKMEF